MESNMMTTRIITRSKLNEEMKSFGGKDGTKRPGEDLSDTGNKKRILGDITNQRKTEELKSTNILESNRDENSVPLGFKDSFQKQNSSEINETLYTTAVESFADQVSEVKKKLNISVSIKKKVPDGVEDFDAACLDDPFSESRYAADIFNYYKEREKLFNVKKYLAQQKDMTRGMRAILIDWMVEVQESFELNHETLYLGVKLVDKYLMKHFVPKAQLQLVGATAILIAAKFDERQPPLVDDFLYICDDNYTREQLIQTEVKILETVDFDLGIPLSYRFLRRYARCARASMELLTLARYILETSLMDYELIDKLDSKLAAAALLLALKMKKQEWTSTHEYYTGYKESELKHLMVSLNKNISAPPKRHLQTIHTKYSHAIFMQVAMIPPLDLKDT